MFESIQKPEIKPMPSGEFKSDEARWLAVKAREKKADGLFYFSVLTTGVYCKPSCGARLPNRENVSFYSTMGAAAKAGFRPCKRSSLDKKTLLDAT